MGPAHRHGPAGGCPSGKVIQQGGPFAAPKTLGPGLEDLLPPRGRVPGGGPAARPIGTRDGEAVPRAEFLRQLLWHYPYAAATATPAKVTAAGGGPGPEEPGVFLLRDPSAGPGPFQRPRFAQDTLGLTPAQRGTAVHTVMQSIRLDRTGSAAAVAEELARLTQQAFSPLPRPRRWIPRRWPTSLPAM